MNWSILTAATTICACPKPFAYSIREPSLIACFVTILKLCAFPDHCKRITQRFRLHPTNRPFNKFINEIIRWFWSSHLHKKLLIAHVWLKTNCTWTWSQNQNRAHKQNCCRETLDAAGTGRDVFDVGHCFLFAAFLLFKESVVYTQTHTHTYIYIYGIVFEWATCNCD